nr:hypothetical protein [Parabacteroides sp. Marseille-P3160]
MNDLFKTEFFDLMNENSEITNEQMQHVYEKFITHIDSISNVGNNLTSIIRKLNIARIELVFLLKQNQYEQGKKSDLKNLMTPIIPDLKVEACLYQETSNLPLALL